MLPIITEFKQNILFYILLFWIITWLFFLINDRYNKPFFFKKSTGNRDLFLTLKDRVITSVGSYISNENKMLELEDKMNFFIPKPKYFYADSNIIELMYSIKEFFYYSMPIFKNIMIELDKFLKIVIYMYDTKDTNVLNFHFYDNLLNIKKEILNNMEQFIFNIPEDKNIENKLYEAIKSMQYILNFHLESIRTICNEEFINNPNTESKYISKDKVQPFSVSDYQYNKKEMY